MLPVTFSSTGEKNAEFVGSVYSHWSHAILNLVRIKQRPPEWRIYILYIYSYCKRFDHKGVV